MFCTALEQVGSFWQVLGSRLLAVICWSMAAAAHAYQLRMPLCRPPCIQRTFKCVDPATRCNKALLLPAACSACLALPISWSVGPRVCCCDEQQVVSSSALRRASCQACKQHSPGIIVRPPFTSIRMASADSMIQQPNLCIAASSLSKQERMSFSIIVLPCIQAALL